MTRVLPKPPDGVQLSPVPNKTVDGSVEWFKSELDLEITPRYIRRLIAEGKLRCYIVARRRMLSTLDLYSMIVTRETSKSTPQEGL